jgi:SAM-dependent methyltransferase
MIRRTGQYTADTVQRSLRIDGPSLRMPEPHFNARTDENTLQFLDEACRRLNDRNTTTQVVGNTIREIYAVLHVRRSACSPVEWSEFIRKARQHPLCKLLHEDAFTRRAFEKPRGYAGDAGLLDHMYATEHGWSPPEMTWQGQRIHRWTTLCSACEGVKTRREMIADLIDQTAGNREGCEVMSLAAGHLREAEFSTAIIRRKLQRLVAIDSDQESLHLIQQEYGRFGVQTLHATARELISGKLDVGSFDLIYTSGLCDYLSDSMCQRLAENLFHKLKPGGKLLLTNFVDRIEAVGYMEVFMDWNLIYRDRMQMMQMTARIPQQLIDRISCFSEENQNVLFLLLERAG